MTIEKQELKQFENELSPLFDQTAQRASRVTLDDYGRFSANLATAQQTGWQRRLQVLLMSQRGIAAGLAICVMGIVGALTLQPNPSGDSPYESKAIKQSATPAPAQKADRVQRVMLPVQHSPVRTTSATDLPLEVIDVAARVTISSDEAEDMGGFGGLYGIDVATLTDDEINNALGAYDEVIAEL